MDDEEGRGWAMMIAAFVWMPVLFGALIVTLPVWLPGAFLYGTWLWIKELRGRKQSG